MAAIGDKLLDAEQLRRRRSELRRRYRTLYDELEKLFYKHDPIGISFEPDEYDPEVELLLPRLSQVRTERELTNEIHAIFQHMFSPETAGPRKRYAPIARDTWELMQEQAEAGRVPFPV